MGDFSLEAVSSGTFQVTSADVLFVMFEKKKHICICCKHERSGWQRKTTSSPSAVLIQMRKQLNMENLLSAANSQNEKKKKLYSVLSFYLKGLFLKMCVCHSMLSVSTPPVFVLQLTVVD